MNTPFDARHRLLRELLRQVDLAASQGENIPADHPDDETVALFAEGNLGTDEQSRVVAHLADCPSCRQTASQLLAMADDEAAEAVRDKVLPLLKTSFLAERRVAWAVAASLFLAVGIGLLWFSRRQTVLAEADVYRQANRLLRDGRFADARSRIADAARRDVRSDRLASLDAEAVREIPHPLALAQAGRLTDFGYDPGGVAARGPSEALHKGLAEAKAVLAKTGTGDLEAVRNQGHVRLSGGDGKEAVALFQQAVSRSPTHPLAWLGLGLADFMKDDFSAAEAAFRRTIALDPANTAARINLAMTLNELGREAEAEQTWQKLLAEPLSAPDRRQVEAALEQLRQRKRP